MKLSLIRLALTSGLMGCVAPSGNTLEAVATGTSEAALGEAGTLTFSADFQVGVAGTLEKGKSVRVVYDANRLKACRDALGGPPGWAITGFWKIGSGDVHSFEAGGSSPSSGTAPPLLTLDQSGVLQLWFQNTNRGGCSAYDSNFGRNYHFVVNAAANEPGWVGNVRSVLSRQTCNGPCESDMRPVTGELLFDTWTRQRAAIRSIFFDVWKDGVTGFDNAELWKQLDVQVHSRVAGSGAFRTEYVAFDRRIGNNARYALDLGAVDPIPGRFIITQRSECPDFPLSAPADNGGQYVEATVELYFTVNGVDLRPAPGAAYRIRYQNYKSLYASCLP